MQLLNIGHNAKTIKSDKLGEFLTGILYFAPYKLSGKNVCSFASPGCIKGCLNTAGMGVYKTVQEARINRTKLLFENRQLFDSLLRKEIESFLRKCDKIKVKPALRLNGLSDLPWFNLFPKLFTDYPEIQHYNYTKVESVMMDFIAGKLPSNYHLTFSRSETNQEKCERVIKAGGNVAVVFDILPKKYLGKTVINGDLHDLRFIDKKNCIVGLKAKGKARKDISGFVVRTKDLICKNI